MKLCQLETTAWLHGKYLCEPMRHVTLKPCWDCCRCGAVYLKNYDWPAWRSNCIHYKMWDDITYSFPNFNSTTVEVWEWISNFIPHFSGYVIIYPCWDESQTMLVKRSLQIMVISMIMYSYGIARIMGSIVFRNSNMKIFQTFEPMEAKLSFKSPAAIGWKLLGCCKLYIHCFLSDVIIHPCHNISGGLIEPLFQ